MVFVAVANKWIHEFGQEFLRRCPLKTLLQWQINIQS